MKRFEQRPNVPFYLMMNRLGMHERKNTFKMESILDKEVIGVKNQAVLLGLNGGFNQQDRMIFDKRRTLDRVLYYSYQGANIIHAEPEEDEKPVRALINPNKLKQDYDDKVISVPYEDNYKPGDVFEWKNTRTHWLIYLQDLTELAYFRGDIRKCSFEIEWEDEEGRHSTYAAIRGPVETKINYIQKHTISVDTPNYSLNILMPKTKASLEYFRRYSKFYIKGTDEGSPTVCWRVDATDWISMPGVLEINATEYYINETEDDIEEGIVGGLIVKKLEEEDPSLLIKGEGFIKPKVQYEYIFTGRTKKDAEWKLDRKYPIEMRVDEKEPRRVYITWKSNYSGQFVLSFGGQEKTIVVESLF